MKKTLVYSLLLLGLVACGEETFVPKPPTYLRLELPDHSYTVYKDDCPYSLTTSDVYTIKRIGDGEGPMCHKDIDLGPLNGMVHLSYIEMTDPLASYVNFVNDKIDEHKVKATAIKDWQILVPENDVYCTFFELQGDVASPFQFYLTDSTDRFVSCVVYFNSVPNYDSLKPSLDYLKIDLEHMINTFKWKD